MRRVISILLFVAAAAFLACALVRAYDRVTFHLNAALSIAAIALIMAAIAGSALVWQILLKDSGVDLPSSEAVRIVALSQLGKYIPGGIWQPLGQIGLAKRAGVGYPNATVTALIFMVVTVLGGLVAGPILLVLSHAAGPFTWLLLLIVPVAVVAHPKVIRWGLGIAARIGRRRVPSIPDVGLASIAKAFAAVLPVWLVYGTSVWLSAQALGLAHAADWTLIAGAFAIAWVIGFLALPVPGGLGVREGIMLLLLGTSFPSADAVAIAVTSRLFFIAGEGALAALSAFLPHRPARQTPGEPAVAG